MIELAQGAVRLVSAGVEAHQPLVATLVGDINRDQSLKQVARGVPFATRFMEGSDPKQQIDVYLAQGDAAINAPLSVKIVRQQVPLVQLDRVVVTSRVVGGRGALNCRFERLDIHPDWTGAELERVANQETVAHLRLGVAATEETPRDGKRLAKVVSARRDVRLGPEVIDDSLTW